MTVDLNICACDVTLNTCDKYCCCDSDCGSAISESWGEQCIYQSAKEQVSWVSCSHGSQVFNSTYLSNVRDTPLTRLFCIHYDNQPF